jgi:ATP-dependent HslUV protease ATP-binding subunit HslU
MLWSSLPGSTRQYCTDGAKTPIPTDENVVPITQPGASVATASLTEADGATALTPRAVVTELDRYIVGQTEAKRAMAIALRNRWRRHQLPAELREEVAPKNILLCGPTGVGKSEIARRLAKLVDAPFVKTEASKYTEVGFHGRDVDQIIRDLVENAILLVKQKQRKRLRTEIERLVEDRILDELTGPAARESTRESFRHLLRKGALEDREIEVEEARPLNNRPSFLQLGDANTERMTEMIRSLDRIFTIQRSSSGQSANAKRRMKIRDARRVIEEAEAERLLSDESLVRMALQLTEQDGIVFLDEIDKICTPSHYRHGADASAEGVQRDLLPLLEGTTVSTKYGNVNTDHILFVAAGAFHQCKPSDLMAELQGRLPIRVELRGLNEADLYRILTEPENSLLKQQIALMRTEGIELEFTDAAIQEMAAIAAEVNTTVENIGARRLHTVVERIIETVSFDAPEMRGQHVIIDVVNVRDALGGMLLKTDLSRFVL